MIKENFMATTQKNEGEGSRTAAKAYNLATTKFAKSGKVEPAARKAKAALKSEAEDMEHAEAIGRRPAKRASSHSKLQKNR
jgi:curli biogenesis system outer membrane secretion channel CsgG